MKSDFKDGVSKAAGRLSSLASSVMSSIQVRKRSKTYFILLIIIK
jgi:hypothetical protein